MEKELKDLTKGEILLGLRTVNASQGRNSMGVSESFYNPFFLLQDFFVDNDIKPETLTECHLKMMIEFAGFTGEVFY